MTWRAIWKLMYRKRQILSINVYLLKKRLSIKEMVMFPQREYS